MTRAHSKIAGEVRLEVTLSCGHSVKVRMLAGTFMPVVGDPKHCWTCDVDQTYAAIKEVT